MGRYTPLSDFLEGQKADRVRLDFDSIAELLGRPLPGSADGYQAWWANDPTHSQARAWLEAGWRTQNLNLRGRVVEFLRFKGRAGEPPDPSPKMSPPLDPWGALVGTVTIHDEAALTSPADDSWEAEETASG